MKVVGIRKVYYSVSNNIICENVKDMVSIESSLVTKYVDEINNLNKTSLTPILYYEGLLIKKFPDKIKLYNLNNFIQYNLVNVLPEYKVKFNNNYVYIIDVNEQIIIKAEILN
jgi:hypothetical protein